jgi:polar amino acid transport system substrate-binding protein
MQSRYLPLLFCYLSLSVHSWAATPKPPEFYFDKDQYPYAYSEQGIPKGLYPQIIQACADILGVDVILKATPWKRALISALSPHQAVVGLYKTEERLEKYHYSEPIYAEKIIVISPLSWQKSFENIEDLQAYRIGITSGWSYGQTLDKAFASGQYRLEYASSSSLALGKLLAGRSELALSTELHAIAFLKSYKARTTHIIHEKILSQLNTYLALSRSDENLEHLKAFNRGLEQLKQQGKYKELVDAFKESILK